VAHRGGSDLTPSLAALAERLRRQLPIADIPPSLELVPTTIRLLVPSLGIVLTIADTPIKRLTQPAPLSARRQHPIASGRRPRPDGIHISDPKPRRGPTRLA
jgi:hypothetical protein